MMPLDHFDAVVIGSGQGGNPLAEALAGAGRRTAIIERKHIGGTCVNEGCTPTKTMVASARVAYLGRRGSEYGVNSSPQRIDMRTIRQRKRDIVNQFRSANEKGLASTANLEVIWGDASFVAEKTIEVALRDGGKRTLTGDQIFINTGTRASVPKIKGLENVGFLDNISVMELDKLPEHLIILGGGYIGLEFAQMFRRFGSEVSLVHRGSQLIDREDADIATEIHSIFAEDGIKVHLSAMASSVSGVDEDISLTFTADNVEKSIRGSHLLVATGRKPNGDTMNLAAAKIETDERGFIRVNERLETSAAEVFALGDVKGGPAFTHISYDDFRILKGNILEGREMSTVGRMVPYTVFMDPQLGRIGLTENEAREQGRKIKIARMPMTHVARALEMAETRGLMKVIVDAESGQILGAAILGIEGGEIASMLQIAMMGKLSYTALRDGTFSHPTLSEALNNVFKKLE
jgi:pyruvate/2-oxoglutarate dehydrogenase complex dihydrolipoamide dehydrogenase (E3) component